MTVYVDLLFGLNTIINYLLLRGSAALGGCPAGVWRLLAAAGIGGVYAVAAVLPGFAMLQGFFCQFLIAVLMLIAAFGLRKNTVKQGLFFLALSFAFSGAVLLLVQAVEPDCVFLGGRAYYAVSMPAMLLLAGACYLVAAVVLKGCGTHTGGDIIPVSVEVQGRTMELRALRDTGNTLKDPMTGQAVLVVEGHKLAQLFPNVQITEGALSDPVKLLERLSRQYPQCRFRLISYRAVGVSAGLLTAVRCRSTIDGKKCTVLAAFSPAQLGDTFNALWGGAIS